MSLLLLIQIMVYDFIDISICTVLALIPFRGQLCSRKKLCLLTVILYLSVVVSRVLSQTGLVSVTILSLIRIALYILLFWQAVKSEQSKRLFVLMVMLNYTCFIIILFHFLASLLFADEFFANPYSFRSSLLLTCVFMVCLTPIYWMMDRKIRPLIHLPENKKMWDYIWLVPATFCIIYHYNVLSNNGVEIFSRNWCNFAFSLAITAGSQLVTYTLIRLIEESNSNLNLKIENYQLVMQTIQHENLKNRMEETLMARHDLRHNMSLIKSYLDDCNYEELKIYIEQYFSTLSLNLPILYCDNYALNAVIAHYGTIAITEGSEFHADIQYPKTSYIPDTDISVLLGNLLENSVEACFRQREHRNFINLWIKQEGDAIIIAIDNSYNGILHKSNDVFLSSKNGHTGIGLISIQRIVDKHHGVAKFEYDDNVFRASIMLNLQ